MQPMCDAGAFSPWVPGVFSLVLFALMIAAFIASQLFLARWLGEKKQSPEKSRAYESGVIPVGQGRIHYPVPFYLVAVFFLLFDVEGAFILSWAVAFRDLGWAGWLQMSFFIVVLLVGLLYIWMKGGLDWGGSRKAK